MKDTAFPELEGDDEAITAFMENSIAITQAALCDDGFEADVQEIADIIERPDNLGALRQRGEWHYNFHRSAEHPRGLWRRLAVSQVPEAGAGWESVFDLDAFCTDTGGDWHWNGVRTLHSNPERVLIALSYQGSDQNRYLEWDCTAAAPVPGGFDLAPARGNAEWLDADSLLVSTADLPGAATRSGWQGRTVRLTRGTALVDAPVVFEVDYEDLVASAYTFPLADGSRGVGFARVRNIGDVVTTVEMAGAQTTIKAPPNTDCAHNDTHYAFVAGDKGSYPAGTLVLGRIGGGDRQVLFSPSTRCAVDEGSLIFYRNHLFWLESDTMVPTIMRLDLRSPDARPAPLPLPVNAEEIWLAPHSDPDGDDGPLQLTTSGFLSPSRTWLFDGTAVDPVYELLVSSPASFDATGMEVRLHMARSEDGTEVPYHIVLPKGYENSSVLPILQYGYGGFSAALAPRYLRTEGPLWLARGGAYVMAYIRGGSEFGRSWHFAAKREYRKNAYSDFASIADDLVARGYTSPNKIACHGSSNGGLLCGVMLTRYPEKFGAVWASVGVYDMLRYHLFPAGAGWTDEYGNPDEPDARAWLLEYSPIHNIQDNVTQAYPPALIDTNESDDRVDPSHSRRFAAALQAAGQPAMYHSQKGGHAGGAASHEIAYGEALGYAFLRDALDL